MSLSPRCPFAGAAPGDIRRCPGFLVEAVAGGDVHGDSGGAYQTCAHLGPESDGRGFYPACHHPDGDWIVPAARLARQRGDVRAEVLLGGPAAVRPQPALERLRAAALCRRAVEAQLRAAEQVGRTLMLQRLLLLADRPFGVASPA